jgi:predicted DNA-binding transcriptional regulator YafY
MEAPERLLALLTLLESPRLWSGPDLAERLGVSRRTLRRDIEMLRSLGHQIEATLGAEGGYRLTAGSIVPPLIVDDDEAVALSLALTRLVEQGGEGHGEAALRALARLDGMLPQRLRQPGAWSERTRTLVVLSRAIASGDRVQFRYPGRDATNAIRRVEPAGLAVLGRHWYLAGFDEFAPGWRIYGIDQVSDLQVVRSRSAMARSGRVLPDGLTPLQFLEQRLASALA